MKLKYLLIVLGVVLVVLLAEFGWYFFKVRPQANQHQVATSPIKRLTQTKNLERIDKIIDAQVLVGNTIKGKLLEILPGGTFRIKVLKDREEGEILVNPGLFFIGSKKMNEVGLEENPALIEIGDLMTMNQLEFQFKPGETLILY